MQLAIAMSDVGEVFESRAKEDVDVVQHCRGFTDD